MAEPRHLKNAPITEAIIDFRVKARSDLLAEEFAVLESQLADRFPKVEQKRDIQVQIVAGKSPASSIQDLGLQGYFFKSADEKNIAQFRTDGFTFNRLKPYTSWDDLFPLAMELWGVYCSVAKPEVVTRLALRYINSVPLPPSLKDFDDYLRAAPAIPPELPQYLSGFLSRITIRNPATDIAAHVVQALERKAAPPTVTVILDIDAYKQHDYNIGDPTIEETFLQLHLFKNDIFFNMLTDTMVKLLE